MKLLLHSCCAPCSVQCVKTLLEDGIKPDLYWYNPNIHPFTEYRSRRDALEAFARDHELSLNMEDEYGLRPFLREVVSMDEDFADHDQTVKRRCAYCYRLRLEKTASVAAERGYEAFSTTLLISPYQNHELLKETGYEFAAKYDVSFLYRDFRPFFRDGRNQAKALGYYMQKYCGCIFSEEERYSGAGK